MEYNGSNKRFLNCCRSREKRFLSSSMTGIFDNRDFFLQNIQLIMSSVLNTVEPKALSKYYSLGYSQTL